MQALTFWKTVVADEAGLLDRLVGVLRDSGVKYCVVGGQAVNAYVEPLVSLDLDLAVAAGQLAAIEAFARQGFRLERFPHRLYLSAPDSDLRVQVQTDPRYAAFVDRAQPRDVLGLVLPVAAVDDVLDGTVWAAQDATRRASKRQKDFADIARLLEAYPHLRSRVPACPGGHEGSPAQSGLSANARRRDGRTGGGWDQLASRKGSRTWRKPTAPTTCSATPPPILRTTESFGISV